MVFLDIYSRVCDNAPRLPLRIKVEANKNHNRKLSKEEPLQKNIQEPDTKENVKNDTHNGNHSS